MVSLISFSVIAVFFLLGAFADRSISLLGEYLEWIVIVLIAAEILVAAINIVVDLYAGE